MYHEIDIKNISSGISTGFPGSTSGKEPDLPTGNARDMGLTPGQKESPEKGMATQHSILVLRIPWTEETGGLQSMGSHRVRHI